MWSLILATLRIAITPLTIAKEMLRNIDADREGIDDKAADGLEKALEVILGLVATDDTVPGQAKGLVAISNYCRSVIARLDEILLFPQPIPPEVRTEAQNLVDSLSDSSKVYQAQRGADAKVLSDTKVEAAGKLTTILSEQGSTN